MATAFGLATFLIYFGVRDLKIIIPLSGGFSFFLYMFFGKVLKIAMPMGILFH